jgi:hypothetical protein
MPAATSIVLADAQATPVNHTFIPLGVDPKDNTVFWFEDQSQASMIGYWRISIQLKRPQQATRWQDSTHRVVRAVVGLHEPILENLSSSTMTGIVPAPTLAYIPRSFTEYVMPERTSLEDRKSLRKMTYTLQANANVLSVVETLQSLS